MQSSKRKKLWLSSAVMVHTVNLSTLEAEAGAETDLCKLKASLVYRVSSGTDRATQKNPLFMLESKQTAVFV